MSKHTPGPWSINDWPQATTDIAIGAVGAPLIAKVPLRDVSLNEQKANASLIAAAPDLLEALKLAVSALERSDYIMMDDDSFDVVDVAREVIYKATGGAA